jgi:hypothetical protein
MVLAGPVAWICVEWLRTKPARDESAARARLMDAVTDGVRTGVIAPAEASAVLRHPAASEGVGQAASLPSPAQAAYVA